MDSFSALTHRIEALQDELGLLKEELRRDREIVGERQEIRDLRKAIDIAAASDKPVLILGLPGTGKKLAARNIHYGSRRADRPLIIVDCRNEDNVGLELFSDERSSKSKLARASGGTVVLDYFDCFPKRFQPALPMLLDSGIIASAGSGTRTKVDIRVIALSNVAIPYLRRGLQDALQRLQDFVIEVPDLEPGDDDTRLLIHHFVRKYGPMNGIQDISPEAMDVLVSSHWIGGVHSLESVIRAAVFCTHHTRTISVRELPAVFTSPNTEDFEDDAEFDADLRKHTAPSSENTPSLRDAMDKTSWSEVAYALRHYRTRKEAAKRLNISPATLYRLKKQFGL
jgi:anaerobic nitric oxide reductase transcription regulator